MKKEILESLQNDKFYDFVINNYYNLDKSELKDLLLNVYFTLYTNHRQDIEEINKEIIDNLNDYDFFEE